ncbi:MAG: helix-turn-helix domain-containing protein [Methanoregula sp.]|jgi:sugar-specific transcriptional regulator TrmB
MHSPVDNLVKLGLKEYEAKIYVALVGIKEANARTIHEVSGVPRPRVYDILTDLTAKGFVEIREGSPLVYRSVPPDTVISRLQKDMNQAAEDSIQALKKLSLNTTQEYIPLWHVNGEWSVSRHVKEIIDRTEGNLRIVAFNKNLIERNTSLIAEAVQKCPVTILLKSGEMDSIVPVPGVTYYETGEIDPSFRERLSKKMFRSQYIYNNAVFEYLGLLISDERESLLIYTYNGELMAIINTIPFIISHMSAKMDHMIAGSHEVKKGN